MFVYVLHSITPSESNNNLTQASQGAHRMTGMIHHLLSMLPTAVPQALGT